MPLERFLIAPQTEGLVNNVLPWLVPDNAYSKLNNVYIWRSRLKKRFGSIWTENNATQQGTRLSLLVGQVQAGGTFAYTVPGTLAVGDNSFLGQQFIDEKGVIYTSYQTAAGGAMLVSDPVGGTATYDIATGLFTITGSAHIGDDIYFFPMLPVMGIELYEEDSVKLPTNVVFDMRWSYKYNTSVDMWTNLEAAAPYTQWSGTDNDFFWASNWRNTNLSNVADNINILFATNFVDSTDPGGVTVVGTTTDCIRYWNGTVWTNFVPGVRGTPISTTIGLGTGTAVVTCKIIISYKGRLILLSTKERQFNRTTGTVVWTSATQIFANRCRYSWSQSILGNVTGTLPTTAAIDNAFFEASGKGGYVDAPTAESIITAELVKDRLIVYFENSTYQLVYTGSPDLPFTWQKLDNNFGATSTLGQVSFDAVVVGVSTLGVIACNGATVKRIDTKIPNEVFDIRASDNRFQRVSGIRDFFEEMIYWTFPSLSAGVTYPQRVLVYDYINGNWAFNDDSFTTFGYHYEFHGLTWGRWHTIWEHSNWPWSTGSNSPSFKNIIAGNQQGWILQVKTDVSSNAPALSIAQMTGNTLLVRLANVQKGEFVRIENCIGSTNLNGTIVEIDNFVNDLTTMLTTITFSGPPADAGYIGGGTLRRVSRIDLLTKQYNFYTTTGQNTFIPFTEFLVSNEGRNEDPAPNPVIKVDFFLSTSKVEIVEDAEITGAQMGIGDGNVLELFPYAYLGLEETQDRFWRRVYFNAEGQTVQFRIYYTDAMMLKPEVSLADFKLHAMLIYASPVGTRFRG